jgi:flagellar protein FlbD
MEKTIVIFEPINEERLGRIRKELTEEFDKPLGDSIIQQRAPGITYRRNGVIQLTKLNNTPFVLNAELIETIESTPDTILSLVTGRKYIVRESVDEVLEKCIAYKRKIGLNRFSAAAES